MNGKKNDAEIIIIGAGAAGLMAGSVLSQQGKKILVLEARNRIGGRIHSIQTGDKEFTHEGGAEFIHGNLEHTLQLVKNSGVMIRPAGGKMIRLRDDDAPSPQHWQLLEEKLETLSEDCTVAEFLQQNFAAPEFNGIRKMVSGFVEGYDTADTRRASIFTFRDEWLHMGEEPQFRINGGYHQLLQFLANEIKEHGNEIYLQTAVKKIIAHENEVNITDSNGNLYTAEKVIITLPLGILQLPDDHPDHVEIYPFPEEIKTAILELGFGDIIKILVSLQDDFRVEKDSAMQGMGFLFSDTKIATWWTQRPDRVPMLTGWVAGPAAAAKWATLEDAIIKQYAVESLSDIYEKSIDEMSSAITDIRVFNWSADPFTRGAYAYNTPQTVAAVNRLRQAINDKIFFAGEAIYTGHSVGTVEAALASGVDVAERI